MTSRLRVWLVVLLVVISIFGVVVVIGATGPWVMMGIGSIGIGVGVWATVHLRRERATHKEEAAQWHASELAMSQRLALARDLHDVVSHGLGLITVRAASARHSHNMEPSPGDLLAALSDIEQVSRTATGELRLTLDSLRESSTSPPRVPTPSCAALPEIIATARRAGLDVEFRSEPLPILPAMTQSVMCAVVGEGLANAAQHAGGTSVTIDVKADQDGVVIDIVDDGPTIQWRPVPGTGIGLAALNERVTAIGGSLRSERVGPGFQLYVALPVSVQ